MVGKDNMIVVNDGEPGAGVTLGEAGIRVDRGNTVDVLMVFDESIQWNRNDNTIQQGAFTFKDTNGNYIGLQTGTIDTAGADLFLINEGNGVITVSGTNNYERNVFSYVQDPPGSGTYVNTGTPVDDDIIPNTKAMTDYVAFVLANTFQSGISDGPLTTTFVETKDFESTGLPSLINFGVDGSVVAQFYGDRLELGDIRISGSEIITTNTGQDLEIGAPGTGAVKINDVLEIHNTPNAYDPALQPVVSTDGIRLYASTANYGKTGLYYVNNENIRDEIISTNRSLLFSMIF
jgi:hypothetical protein